MIWFYIEIVLIITRRVCDLQDSFLVQVIGKTQRASQFKGALRLRDIVLIVARIAVWSIQTNPKQCWDRKGPGKVVPLSFRMD